MAESSPFGTPIIVSPALPAIPSPGEDARRYVRHGCADILEWLGEPVGPRPGEPTHAIMGFDAASDGAVIFVSREFADRLMASRS